MKQAVLGIDLGTSALKAGLLTLTGELVGLASARYPMISTERGAHEQDAGDWWRALGEVARVLLAHASGELEVLAIAVGGYAPALCPVDSALEPTHGVITWLDQRPADEARRLYDRLGRPVPTWGSWPAQAAWFLSHRPDAAARTRWLLGCPDYIVARLTGEPVSLLEWSTAELDAGEIDARFVPPQRSPGHILGIVTAEAAQQTGLPRGVPVVAGYVDGIMGVLGSGAHREGDACLNGGTSGTLSVITRPGLGYALLGMWVAGAATNASGRALDWFFEQLQPTASGYEESLAGLTAVRPGADGLLFLPHLAGERAPVIDGSSRGAWVGLTLEHDRRHLLRSVLEGVAFSFRALQDALIEQGLRTAGVYCIGGQARSAVWNQIKADVLNRTLLVPSVIEATVVGAAILATVGIGHYASREAAVAGMVHVGARFEPDAVRAAAYDALYPTYRALYAALRDSSSRLDEFASTSSGQLAATRTASD